MALLDLSQVTRTLVKALDEAVKASPVSPGSAQTTTVTSLPPDRLTGTGDSVLGVYLYHVVEEAALKNQVWPGRPPAPRFVPLGLNLHYLVCAHSDLPDEKGPYREQLLMGIALKALHDNAIIDEATTINGVPVLATPLVGEENRLRLALRHVPVTEAISFWTSGSQPLRLCAYYEVSVVLLEPDEPATATGRVLAYGIETFVGGLPRLHTTRSSSTFTIPGETAPRVLDVQPAQVAIGEALTLVGSGLGSGPIALRVRGDGWPAPREVDPAWGVSGLGDQVFATVQADADGAPVLPGAYAASIVATRTTELSDGTTRTFTVVSNETPFQVVPEVTPGAVAATGVFAISGRRFAPAAETRVSIASEQLVAGTAGSLQPGQFAVTSETAIEVRLPAGLVSGDSVPVRVTIRGAESAPRWVKVP
jgi:hypothetical protein